MVVGRKKNYGDTPPDGGISFMIRPLVYIHQHDVTDGGTENGNGKTSLSACYTAYKR